MKFICANELPFDVRPQMSYLFVEGFYSWIKYFSKDKDKLKETFKHIFDLEYFYVAVEDGDEKANASLSEGSVAGVPPAERRGLGQCPIENGKIVAMTATTKGHAPITLQRKEFTKALGYIKGCITYYILNKHMVRNAYPFTLSPKTGTIEFVATAPDYRGKGIAFDLISFIINRKGTLFTSYILEVADTNEIAVRLYEKLGFKEIKRVKAPNPKRSGVNYFLYMRRDLE